MKTIIQNLDNSGFIDVANVPILKTQKSSDSISKELKQALPKLYRDAIEQYEDDFKKTSLLKAANSITLYLNSRYANTPISKSWNEIGRIPYYLGKGLGTTFISNLAANLIKTNKNINKENLRLRKIESKKKITKRESHQLDKIDERLNKLIIKRDNTLEDFYYKFLDMESSLAGGF